MPYLISAAEISAMADKPWTDAQTKRAETLLLGIDGWLERNAPCLTSNEATSGVIAEGREIVAEALLRAISAGTGNVASQAQAIGPDSTSTSYVDRAALPTLTLADRARLLELCPPPKTKRRGIGVIRMRPGY